MVPDRKDRPTKQAVPALQVQTPTRRPSCFPLSAERVPPGTGLVSDTQQRHYGPITVITESELHVAGPDTGDWRQDPIVRIAVPIGIIVFTLLVIVICFVGWRKYLRSRRQYEYEMNMISPRSRKDYIQDRNIICRE